MFGSLVLFFVGESGKSFFGICRFERRNGYVVGGLIVSCFWFCERLGEGCFVVGSVWGL